MAIRKVLITGSCGLVGYWATNRFLAHGAHVRGIDNNDRKKWFGPQASTMPLRDELLRRSRYKHTDINILNSLVLSRLVSIEKPDVIINCAAQPSHDKSASIPWEDFMVNATGTMNLLEAARQHAPNVVFIQVSTNKVYGDQPNQLELREEEKRFDFSDQKFEGIDESMSIDQSMHSPFGASKAAADLMVQEYGRYYGMKTACFRCGCLTGENHMGVELHGFLSYLCKSAKENKTYTIFGHSGKQVRDNLHANDLAEAFYQFAMNPRVGEVYNMGGGKENSCSVLEAIDMIEQNHKIQVKHQMGPARKGDHICYYSDTRKFRSHYPEWSVKTSLQEIFSKLLFRKELFE